MGFIMDKKSKRPVVNPGCIGCGYCQFVCPEVFRVNEVSTVQECADYDKYRQSIEKAMQECPMHAIEYKTEE